MEEVENIDYIICPICKKKKKRITYNHIIKHNLTQEEFIKLYPNQKLICEKTKYSLANGCRGKQSHKKGKTLEQICGIDEAKRIKNKMSEYSSKPYIERFGEEKAKLIGKKISKSNIGIPKNKGIKKSAEHSRKLRELCIINSKKRADKIRGKTRIEIFGEEKSKLIDEKVSRKLTGQTRNEKQCRNISIGTKNGMRNLETLKKLRIAFLKRIEKNYGICIPNYTPSACEWFKKFDEKNNTHGRYAMYGDGEYLIREIVRWPDYINFELKIIIECDTPDHFDRFGNELLKYIERLKEIQEFYPDFKIYRFKKEEMYKILEINIRELVK